MFTNPIIKSAEGNGHMYMQYKYICYTQAHTGTIEETDFKIYYFTAFVHASISHGF